MRLAQWTKRAFLRPTFRNVGYNLAGQLLPMAIAVVALPVLARHAGTDRLGFLGLAWSLIGYFALLDLGLSRIVTRRVAVADLQGRLRQENRVVRRLCVRLLVVAGAVSGLLALIVQVRWIVGASAGPVLLAEARAALPVLLLTIPTTVVTGLLRGALEGLQRFGTVNLLRATFGALSFAAPLLVLPLGADLLTLTLSIAVVRVLSLGAHAWWALRALEDHGRRAALTEARVVENDRVELRDLVREGGWLTVSNVVGPLMVTFDRFAVAGIVSLTAASHYFVPQEMALRLLVVPGAVATTIFPMLARLATDNADRRRISRDSLLSIAATSLPACAALAALSQPLLAVWMGADFAVEAAPVAAIIAVGLFANCCAQAPFAWIQAAGRADVTGKLHLLQLPLYLLILAALTWRLGVIGAALAWSVRALTDCGLLFAASARLFPSVDLKAVLLRVAVGVVALSALACQIVVVRGPMHTIFVIVLLAVCLLLSLSMALRLKAYLSR